MNERIKELAVQAGMEWDTHSWCWLANPPHLERFAELVRQNEREKCAKLCDDEARQSSSDHEAGGMYWCAEAIRARGER
jgi:hypothetical protein